LNTAARYTTIDTTALKIGHHNISWAITDNNNQTASAGNRTFAVSDGTAAAEPLENRTELKLHHTEPVRNPHPPFRGRVMLRRGYDLNAPLDHLIPDKTWTYEISIQQLDRLELHLQDTNSSPVACTSSAPLSRSDRRSMRRCLHFTGRSTPAPSAPIL
jgi:hypothetical protein